MLGADILGVDLFGALPFDESASAGVDIENASTLHCLPDDLALHLVPDPTE